MPLPCFTYSPTELEGICAKETAVFLQALEKVAATPPEKIDFMSTVGELERAGTAFTNATSPLVFLKFVSPDSAVRTAADQAETAVQKLFIDIYAREDLFRPIKRFSESGVNLSRKESRLLEECLISFKRNGLELPPDRRRSFIEKKKRLVAVESEFSKNIMEWKDGLELSREELDGLSDSFIQGLEKTAQGKYKLSLDYPHYYPFMENAKNEGARRNFEFKFNNRGGEENLRLLEEAIRIRQELAALLGYPNHAAFVLERRMAKTPEAVQAFLARLALKLKKKGEKDLQVLIEAKEAAINAPADAVHAWEWRYYANQVRKQKYQVDAQRIREYFPLEVVLTGLLEIHETLFGVKFAVASNTETWHSTVRHYEVIEKGKSIAHVFMDLFPRAGKYNHAAAFTLISGCRGDGGIYTAPVSAIVANFNPPGANGPALLEHSEVETLFHEFGHIMHQVLTRAEYATFSGTNVKTDYVEAPSQMVENWVWKRESLEKLSSHYKDPEKRLPDELIDKMIKAKNFCSGIKALRQLAFATIDMSYHTNPGADPTETYKRLMKEIMGIPVQEGTLPQASFGHLMGGYDAGYYSYLWSEVYAQDLFTRFEKEGLFNPRTGADYRKWILEPGGTEEPSDLILGFLGREPNEEAFLRKMGITG